MLAISGKTLYNVFCCGMIAVKREVAAFVAGFPWSECQVRKLTTSHCTNFNGLPEVETTCGRKTIRNLPAKAAGPSFL
jgi:hypothetical protein